MSEENYSGKDPAGNIAHYINSHKGTSLIVVDEIESGGAMQLCNPQFRVSKAETAGDDWIKVWFADDDSSFLLNCGHIISVSNEKEPVAKVVA